MLEILNYLREIFNESKTYDEQPDTTGMLELESGESAAQRRNQKGKDLKILTPSHMLSRLPIYLAQLRAGNNKQLSKA